MQKINLASAFASFDEQWSPRIAAELNRPSDAWENLYLGAGTPGS